MNKNFKYIGKRIEREDSLDKARGKARYLDDIEKSNMLHGKIYMSDKPHAIVTIDKESALKIEGVTHVFTYEDVPKNKYCSHQWFPGADVVEDENILQKKARFVGDRIALVLGETKEAVNKGIKALNVTYEELEPVIGIEEAKKDKSIINGDTNLAFSKTLSCGDTENAFNECDYIVEDEGKTPKIHHSAIENHACLAELDEFNNIIVYAPCQVVFQVRHIIAKATSYPYNKIRVKKITMGGSFGGKGLPILEPVCAFASLKTGRPVKIVMNRSETIMGSRSRNSTMIKIKTGFNKDGKIIARKIDADIDGGGHFTNAAAVTMAMGKKAFRLYDIENQIFNGKSYYTNTVPGGACRGYGSPQIHAVSEINIDNCAKKIKMDPVQFRLINVVEPRAKDPIGAPELGNARIKDCLIKGSEAFNWIDRRKSINTKNTERYSYGIGVAAGTHGNGYHGSFPDFTNVNISVLPNNRIWIKIGIHDLGCGTVLTMQQIAAEVFNISTKNIDVPQADTFVSPYDSAGTQASRVTFVCGGAVKKASEELIEKMLKNYMKLFNCEIEDILYEDGYIWNKGNDKITYGDLAVLVESKFEYDLEVNTKYKSPGNPAVYAVSFAEVKVDNYSGLVEIEDILAVHDLGQAINKTLVEGQIEGGAQMSIGMALTEEIEYRKDGTVKTDNFSKYHIINSPSMPKVKSLLIEDGEPGGPFGAKSVGEITAVTPGPAVINAVNHALDTNLCDHPATPERIIKALLKK